MQMEKDRVHPPGAIPTDIHDHIVVVALIEQRQRFDLYRSAVTDAAGTYRFNAIPPGSYKVFAWEDIEPHSWNDNALLRGYEDLGKSITVAEGSSQTMEVMAISPFER